MNKTLKKITAVFTSAMMLTSAFAFSTTSVAADDEVDTYLVAGDKGDIFGTAWDSANHDNDMTAQANGTWTKTYTVDQAFSEVQLKTVKNESEWIGDDTGNNVLFNLTGAGTFTVTYDPDPSYNDGAGVTTVSGDIVEMITEYDYSFISVAGNGEGTYLNGYAWQPSAPQNVMTEIAPDVWQISFSNVGEAFERQIKFVANGDDNWVYNWGAPDYEDGDDMNNHFGEWMDAKFNSSNIFFDTDDTCTVVATFDISNFDVRTKQGAKFKLDIVYEDDDEPNFLVAGRTANNLFGTDFDPANHDNDMTTTDGITYTKSYTVDAAIDQVLLKVVENESIWHGDANGDNIDFSLTGAGTFTVEYNRFSETITVTGANVHFATEADFVYSTVTVAGNGERTYLNGASWAPATVANDMTEISPKVYQITYTNITDGYDRQAKFCLDHDWTAVGNFGQLKDGNALPFRPGKWFDAKWDGDNIKFDTLDDCTVTFTLDLTNFSYVSKQGAKYKVDIEYDWVLGDADEDGEITINDATLALRYLAEFDDAEVYETAMDVNYDGVFNVNDITDIQRYVAQVIDEF